jgi:upstream activation factor subunit UAF30
MRVNPGFEKAAIKELIMERFDIFARRIETGASPEQVVTPPTINGHSANNYATMEPVEPLSPTLSASPQKRGADADSLLDMADKPPPKKKRKADMVDADAIFAARLQAEENLRARPTRAGNARKAIPVRKKKGSSKPKTSKKIRSEDDSDLDGSGSDVKKEVNRTGGFHVSRNYLR